MTLIPRIDLSLRQRWGDLRRGPKVSFAGNGDSFESIGSGLDAQSVAVDAGVDFRLGPVRVSGSYRGELGKQWQNHAAMWTASLPF